MDYAQNKSDLISYISKETSLSSNEAKKALEAVISGITKSLKENKPLRFLGFGTFSIQERAATQGRNPRTGDLIQIAASKNAVFKSGKELKDAVNTGAGKAKDGSTT